MCLDCGSFGVLGWSTVVQGGETDSLWEGEGAALMNEGGTLCEKG